MLTSNSTKKEPKLPRRSSQSTNSILYSAAALGAAGGLIAPEAMFAEAIQTFVLPQGYRKTDNGRVLLHTQDGQPLYLTEEQYAILDDGLLTGHGRVGSKHHAKPAGDGGAEEPMACSPVRPWRRAVAASSKQRPTIRCGPEAEDQSRTSGLELTN